MNATRPNLYKNIHKGIRSMLADLVGAAGRVDWNDALEVAEFRANAHSIFGLLDGHAELENEFLAPLLEAHAQRVATIINGAHHEQEEEIPAILSQLEGFNSTAADAPEKGHALVIRLSRFAAENLAHMADEEELAMPALQAALPDSVLLQVEHKLVASIPPEKMAKYGRRMLPAMNDAERVTMLSGMKAAGQQPFEFGMRIAAESLSQNDYAALERALDAIKAA